MAIPLFVSSSSFSAVDVTSMTVPYAVNEQSGSGGVPPVYEFGSPPQSGETSWLFLVYRRADFSAVNAPTISGWTVLPTATPSNGTGLHFGVWYKQGDGISGGAAISWNTTVYASATIVLVDQSHTTAPIGITGSTATGSNALGIHASGSIDTTEANDLLLGAWYGPGTDGYWAQFGYTIGYFYATAGGMEGISQISSDSTPPPGGGSGKGQIVAEGSVPAGILGNALSLNYKLFPTAGPTGSIVAISQFYAGGSPATDPNASANIFLVAVKPYQGPTRPTITAPITGETITIGRTYAITWNPSTDPSVAQSLLKYNVDYSDNDGLTWHEITALTSAGAQTVSWNTTGKAASPQYKIRVRAYNGTEYSSYHTTGRFILAADVSPSAPTGLHGEQPSGTTVTLFDRANALTIKGTFSDLGDVQTGFQIDWGTDGVSYPNASGTIASSTLSLDFAGGTFSAGLV